MADDLTKMSDEKQVSTWNFQQLPNDLRFYNNLDSTPIMTVYPQGEILLRVNHDGKYLEVMKTGLVRGDLPLDEAARTFWEAIARVFPKSLPAPPDSEGK